MSSYGVKDTAAYRGALVTKVLTGLEQAKLDPAAVGADARVVQVAEKVVDAFATELGNVPPEMQRRLVADTLSDVQAPLQTKSAALAATVGKAATQARDAAHFTDSLRRTLDSAGVFGTLPLPAPSRAVLQAFVEAVIPLAAVAGAGLAHDHHYALAVGKTTQGNPAELGHRVGDDGVNVRATHMPYARLRELGSDELLLQAVAQSATGIEGALTAFGMLEHEVAALDGTRGNPAAFAEAASGLPSQLPGAVQSMSDMVGVLPHLDKVEGALKRIHAAAERDTTPDGSLTREALNDPRNSLGRLMLLGTQAMWVKDQVSQGNGGRFGADGYKHLDELHPQTAVRNLPVAVAALEGAKVAVQVVQDVLSNGVDFFKGIPGEDAAHLQHLLEASARWSLNATSMPERNGIHSRAVALESSLSLVTTLGHRDEAAVDLWPSVQKALLDVSFASGEHFYVEGGEKAAASTRVAVQGAGEVLAALHPEQKRDWNAYALDLGQRVSLEDVDDIRQQLFGGVALEGDVDDLRRAMGDKFADDSWFVGHVTGADNTELFPSRSEQSAAGRKPLSDEERKDLAAILFTANVGWKSGQAFRADGDRTRVDSFLRGKVYDTYENLIRAGKDPLEVLYVMLKDGWEVFDASRTLAA